MIRQTGAHGPPVWPWMGVWGGLVIATAAMSTVVVTAASTIVVAVVAPIVAAVFTVIPPVLTVFDAIVVSLLTAMFAIVVAMAMPFLVARGVLVPVPVVLDEIDAFAAGAVVVAMPAPVPGVAGRDAQVKRRATDRYALDHQRFGEKKGGRGEAADVEAAVETGLADVDRDLGGGGRAQGGGSYGKSQKQSFHGDSLCWGLS